MPTIESRRQADGTVTYRVKVRVKGSAPVTATFKRRTDARRWATSTEAAICERRYFKDVEAEKHILRDAIDRYIQAVIPTKRNGAPEQVRQLNWWAERLGDRPLSEITPAVVAEQRDYLLSTPIPPKGRSDGRESSPRMRSPSTVVRYLAVLSHVFSVARREWAWVTENPLARVTRPKEPRGRARYLDKDELDTLLEACRKSRCKLLYALVVLAVSTGMRLGEILSLQWHQVDFEHERIVLHQTKNGERRAVPLLHHARDILLHLPNAGADALVFPGRNPAKPICIHKAWGRALQVAGISDFRFHDLRHTAASHLAMQGASPLDIAQVLGHRTLQMVRRYAHLSDGHVRSVMERMNSRLFTESGGGMESV